MTGLALSNLTVGYRSGRHVTRVLSGVTGSVVAGQMIGLVGPNGAGKSTLFKTISGVLMPRTGSIRFEGVDIQDIPAARRPHLGIAHVPEGRQVFPSLTVMENLLCGRLGYISPLKAWLRKFPADDIKRAFELLETVGLAGFANQRADSLSGGQRQRVGIARAIMQAPKLLLADEPTSSLDPKTSVEIMELLRDICGNYAIPVVVNMHDVELARRFADRIIGMAGGRVVYDGGAAGLSDDVLKTIYGGEGWLH